MKKRTESILSVVHETAKDLRNVGIMDEMTMREFDVLCLPSVKTYQPQEIPNFFQNAPKTSVR